LSASNPSAGKLIEIDAEKRDGLVKILAEPTIMAISGQEGSFLAGGTILIPVDQADEDGGITLEEKDFGVSLKFTPTVLADGRINLRVKPEVSEVSPEGIGISGGLNGLSRSVLPLILVRRAETTVQLRDGQSFAIGGLVKNNVVQNIKAFPILGELPILGALFRSSDFENEKSELVFIITPRLVKPLPPDYRLPTDSYIEPSRAEVFLGGKMEGTPPAAAENPQATSGATPPAATPPAANPPAANPPAANPPAASGFELK
jgi:pilus assembly protein CpaC